MKNGEQILFQVLSNVLEPVLEIINQGFSNNREKTIDDNPSESDDGLDKLLKAKELLDMGILTQEEFDEIKAKCLKQI